MFAFYCKADNALKFWNFNEYLMGKNTKMLQLQPKKYIHITKNHNAYPVKKKRIQKKSIKDQIENALKGESYQVVYISSTKGAMKLAFKGHHYKYSFKRNNLSIFQCCYIQNNINCKQEQCTAKVLVHSERAYPMDQEHSHIDLAFDKSTTPTTLIMKSVPKPIQEKEIKKEQSVSPPVRILNAPKKVSPGISTQNIRNKDENFKVSKTTARKTGEIHIDDDDDDDDDDSMSPEDFRKKIKARLSRFLLKK